jgi:diguanylate cyclase
LAKSFHRAFWDSDTLPGFRGRSPRSFDARIRAYLTEAALLQLGFDLSYSAGIAMRESQDDTLEAMLRRANVALYNAKAHGRARTLDAQEWKLRAA